MWNTYCITGNEGGVLDTGNMGNDSRRATESQHHSDSSQNPVHPIDVSEMKTFIGICIVMGVGQMPRIHMY